MANEKIGRILIAAGDYEVVEKVRAVLEGANFDAECTFSHRDALYSLGHGTFDAAVVDVRMRQHRTHESTMSALARGNQRLPLVAYAPDEQDSIQAHMVANAVIDSLGKEAILSGVSEATRTFGAITDLLVSEADNGANENLAQYTQEVRTLFNLVRSLAEVLDLTEVLNRVVEAARHLTSAEEGMILMPDEADDTRLDLRAKVGIEAEAAQSFRVKTQDTLAGYVYRTGQPVLVGEQGPQKVKTAYFVNSLLYVPIMLKGETMGVLGVNNRNKHDVFDLHDQDMLANLASFAAIAIENARVHEETVEHARELSVLVESSQIVNTSLAFERTLPRICEQLARVLNVDWAEIFELDAGYTRLTTLARYQRAMWLDERCPVLPLGRFPEIRAALESGRILFMTATDSSSESEKKHMQRLGVAAMLVVPVMSGEEALGAVQLYYVKPPKLPPDQEVLRGVKRLGLEGLSEVTKGAVHSEHIYKRLEEINLLAGAAWSELGLFGLSNSTQTLRIQSSVGKGIWLGDQGPVLDVAEYRDLLRVFDVNGALNVHFGDDRIDAGARAFFDATHSEAILGLPLVQRGEVQGLVLFADARRAMNFSERDMNLGRAIVGQAATALENARLFSDLEASLRELKETQERLIETARLSAMGELAAAVAHQINNPLTTIMVDAEMMLLDEPPDSPNHQALTAIFRAGKRAATVARRLLAVARPTDRSEQQQPVDLLESIEGVLSLVSPHIQRDGIEISTKLPSEPLPSVWALPGQLDDIWLNLLLNAHDALIGQAGAKIGIDVEYKQDALQIDVQVWDNGPGIPEDMRERVFEPFFTTKPVGQGTGLGLHISQQMVGYVGGSIVVDSDYNEGARFCVCIPIRRGSES